MTTKLFRMSFLLAGILSTIATIPLLGGRPASAAETTHMATHSSAMSKSTRTISYQSKPAMKLTHRSTIHPVLTIGSRGPAVREVQAFLRRDKLYHGSIDGTFGKKTQLAVMQLQGAKGLRRDGVVGSRTWKAIT